MDLSTYFRSLRRIAWLLVLVPVVVAAGSAFYLARSTAPTYTAVLQFALPTTSAAARSTDQLTDDYKAAAASDEVAGAVSTSTRLSTTDIQDNLTVARVGTAGSYMSVSLVAEDSKKAAAAASAIALDALHRVLQPEIDANLSIRQQLQAQYDALQQQATLVSTVQAGAGFSAADSLQRQQQMVLGSTNDVNVNVVGLQARLATADKQITAATVTVTKDSRILQIAPRAVVNGGGCLFLLVALLLAVELLRSGRRREAGDGGPVAPLERHPAGRPVLQRDLDETPVGAGAGSRPAGS